MTEYACEVCGALAVEYCPELMEIWPQHGYKRFQVKRKHFRCTTHRLGRLPERVWWPVCLCRAVGKWLILHRCKWLGVPLWRCFQRVGG